MAMLWNVVGEDGGHLPPLHLRDPAARMQDEDVEGLPVAAGLDRRRAGVSGGGAKHRDPLAPARQDQIEQPPQHLQRIVLEGEGRPVEQLHEPLAGP